jgi:rubrerythrin
MPELRGSETEANLKAAFASESEASQRYLYFAQQADVEGQPKVAALFRTIAEGETGHAVGHLDFLIDVGDPATGLPMGSTEENLASAAAAERNEATAMYPQFAATARAEGLNDIADWLDSLCVAEQAYADRLAEALDELD